MNKTTSPLAPKNSQNLPDIKGVRLMTANARTSSGNRATLFLAILDEGTSAAGLFTTSQCRAAPVDWSQSRISTGKARAVIVNAGNANAFTGTKGTETVALTASMVAKSLGCQPEDVLVASTGIIGRAMDADIFRHITDKIGSSAPDASWIDAAEAIMTTDTYPKLATRQGVIAGSLVTINGIAKGSGMIAPHMATMLGFVFTDASIPAAHLQSMVSRCARDTFNAITVDGDTSTNDSVFVFATGTAPKSSSSFDSFDEEHGSTAFENMLFDLFQDLALQIVRDGEGAQKLVSIVVLGAEDDASARRIAFSIANSLLVKTAIAGEDPNWGRVIMAVGKTGEKIDKDRLTVRFGPHRVAHHGSYDPAHDPLELAAYMKNQEIDISVELNIGTGKSQVWTCDMTHGYIDINALYKT